MYSTIERPPDTRRGGVMPLMLLCTAVLFGFVALAIDLGALMVARSQCQHAADAAALTGARQLTGDPATDYNKSAAQPAALAVATATKVLNKSVKPSEVTIEVGSLRYDTAAKKFVVDPADRAPGDAWSLVRATVNYDDDSYFGKIFNVSALKTQAVATAAHRPRDVALVVDFSGSMRYGSLLGAPITAVNSAGAQVITTRNTSMNPDAVYPRFGHYASGVTLKGSSTLTATTGELIDLSNHEVSNGNGDLILGGFFQDATPLGTGTPAFTPLNDTYQTAPDGDVPSKALANSGVYAVNVNDLVLNPRSVTQSGTAKNLTWETDGYGSSFKGYTAGPRFWGKTFFIWPPDPRGATNLASNGLNNNNGAKDWRQRFFIKVALGNNTSTSTTGGSSGSGGGSSGGGSSGGGGSTPPPPNTPPPPASFRDLPGLAREVAARVPTLQSTTAVYSPLDYNLLMWDGNGNLKAPGTRTQIQIAQSVVNNPDGTTTTTTTYENYTYLVNYDAILYWLKNAGPETVPPRLRAGGVLYYDAIPDTIDTATHPLPTGSQAQKNARFWKEYIDEVLGVQQRDLAGAINGVSGLPRYNVITGFTGYGGDYSWTTTSQAKIYAKPDPSTDGRYLDYRDNPRRPKTRLWFGGMTMVDFISNPNMGRAWMPGTVTESPLWQCKVGVQTTLNDIKANHPNDLVTVISFSGPVGQSPTGTNNALVNVNGYYNTVRAPLGRDYNKLINSLWFAPRTAFYGEEFSPYDADITEVPRAAGSTNYSYALMLAYNQFSGNAGLKTYSSTLPEGTNGGIGRKGAQKLVVFETDGACSSATYDSVGNYFTDAGSYESYFKIRIKSPQPSGQSALAGNELPNNLIGNVGVPEAQAEEIAKCLCNKEDGSKYAGLPRGYSSERKPVRIHCLAYGSLFDASAAGGSSSTVTANRAKALALLQKLQYIGNVQQDETTPLESYKIIIGTADQRIDLMQQALSKIMQDGYSMTLIE